MNVYMHLFAIILSIYALYMYVYLLCISSYESAKRTKFLLAFQYEIIE